MPDSVNEGKMFFREWFSTFNPKTVLDAGAGVGTYGKMIREINPCCYVEAIEVYEPYIKEFNLDALYEHVYNQDIRDFAKESGPQYDLIILGDVLEHLPKQESIEIWKLLKCRAKFLYLSLPLEVLGREWSRGYHQHPREYEVNPHEKHEYLWELNEVIKELGPFMWQVPFKTIGVFIAEGDLG